MGGCDMLKKIDGTLEKNKEKESFKVLGSGCR